MTMRDMTDLVPRYLRWLTAQGMSRRTVDAREEILRRVDLQLPYGLENSTEEEITDWLGRPGLAQASRCTYHFALLSFYQWATRPSAQFLEINPMVEIPAPKSPRGRPRPLPPDVIDDILTRAVQPFHLHAVLALYAGLRCCEIAGLHREDVTEKLIDVRAAKGGSPQVAFGHPEIWREVRDFPPGLLVVHAGGIADAKWISIRTAVYFRRQLGYPVGLHRFRHSLAGRLRADGHDLFVIAKAMRHATIQTTQIYAEAGDGEVATAVANLPAPTRPAA